MKVILERDIASVGKKHDVVTVSDGYALNSLIPNGAAIAATPSALARLERNKAETAARKAAADALISKDLGKIDGTEITIERTANEKGHLFAAVHAADISAAIAAKTRLAIEAEHIALAAPIKEAGTSKVSVTIGGKRATIIVTVTAKQDSEKA